MGNQYQQNVGIQDDLFGNTGAFDRTRISSKFALIEPVFQANSL
jgi:hypothetical protein